MFEIELIGFLNRYKKSSDKNEKEKLKKSIEELTNQNQTELKHFLESQEIDEESKQFLNSYLKEEPEEGKEKELQIEQDKKESQKSQQDVQIIMDYYQKWLDSYHRNSDQVTDECSKVVKDIINYYIVNHFDILLEILSMDDTQDFEKFKNHLKNNIRAYFGQKINEYFEGKYTELGFFAKMKKKAQIKELIKEIGKYEFNREHIEEVLR